MTEEIPKRLLLDLIGEPRPVLYMEGTDTSPEVPIFRHLFPNLRIHQVNGVGQVLEITRSWNQMRARLLLPKAHAFIDSDDRDQNERKNLLGNNIYMADAFMEIEGLFLVQDVALAFFNALSVCHSFGDIKKTRKRYEKMEKDLKQAVNGNAKIEEFKPIAVPCRKMGKIMREIVKKAEKNVKNVADVPKFPGAVTANITASTELNQLTNTSATTPQTSQIC